MHFALSSPALSRGNGELDDGKRLKAGGIFTFEFVDKHKPPSLISPRMGDTGSNLRLAGKLTPPAELIPLYKLYCTVKL
jgi:hypothetical protein